MKKIRNAYDFFKLFGVAMVIWVVLFIVISVVVGVAGLLLFLFLGVGTTVSCVRQYKLSNYLDGVGPEPRKGELFEWRQGLSLPPPPHPLQCPLKSLPPASPVQACA